MPFSYICSFSLKSFWNTSFAECSHASGKLSSTGICRYWNLIRGKAPHQIRSQLKVLDWFWSFLSCPVLASLLCWYWTIAMRVSLQRYQKRSLLWWVCSLSPRAEASWGLHRRNKATRCNVCPVYVLECCGTGASPSFTSLWTLLIQLKEEELESKRNERQHCLWQSPLHALVSSAALVSPIAVPSNASGDGEVMQPRVLKQYACLSLSPFYSQ